MMVARTDGDGYWPHAGLGAERTQGPCALQHLHGTGALPQVPSRRGWGGRGSGPAPPPARGFRGCGLCACYSKRAHAWPWAGAAAEDSP
jgi:hypothetical protein